MQVSTAQRGGLTSSIAGLFLSLPFLPNLTITCLWKNHFVASNPPFFIPPTKYKTQPGQACENNENNRSLLANPFVSMVLIHPSKPSPPPPSTYPPTRTAHPPLTPDSCTIDQAFSPLKQLTALLKPILIPQTVKRGCTTVTVAAPPTSTHQQTCNSGSTLSLFSSRSSFVATGNKSLHCIACFVLLCKTYFKFASAGQCVCALEREKYCCFLSFFLFLACVHLLLFVLTTVNVMNELESNTATPQVVFFLYVCVYVLVLFTSCEREREGGRG